MRGRMVPGSTPSEQLDETGSSPGDAALLAIPPLIQGYLSVSEVSELLSVVAQDLQQDGTLTDAGAGQELMNAAWLVPCAGAAATHGSLCVPRYGRQSRCLRALHACEGADSLSHDVDGRSEHGGGLVLLRQHQHHGDELRLRDRRPRLHGGRPGKSERLTADLHGRRVRFRAHRRVRR